MKNMICFVILVLLYGLLFTTSSYAQKIGIINDEVLRNYPDDYLKQKKVLISDIANKKKLSVVIHSNGLIWIASDKNKIDITDDILSLKSNDKNPLKTEKQNLDTKNATAINNVLKALHKINGVTEIDISYSLYGEKVVDTKGEVSENLFDVPDGDIKNELQKAMDAYSDALSIWKDCIEAKYISIVNESPIIDKYNIERYSPSEYALVNEIYRKLLLTQIWHAGLVHTKNAENIYKKTDKEAKTKKKN
jgi:hypothetical protein